MKKLLCLLICTFFLLSSCAAETPARPGEFQPGPGGGSQIGAAQEDANEIPAQQEFIPEPVVLSATFASGEQPVYLYLFTHTEDQFNHELSEERYTRLAPVVAELAQAYPNSGLVWTIEFQGTDARTVGERNAQTGIVDLLVGYAEEGWIDFGYHAHHDPTYLNRPQTTLSENSTWAERVTALDTWVSCEKDPVLGSCIADIGGGLLAIQEFFGPVQVVSGLGYESGDTHVTGGAGRHALIHYAPEYMVAFGYSDHSPASREEDYSKLVNELMDILTPTQANSEGLFWMDDALRLNDAAVVDSVGKINLDEGKRAIQTTMETMERNHVQVVNAGFASKWIYTASGSQSPTQWGYSHPEDPELPVESINPKNVINKNYQNNIAALEYLVTDFMVANPGSQFIGSGELLTLAAPADYWQVSDAELDAIARWLLQEWGVAPPAFASDGVEFYSLRDAAGLLAQALSVQTESGDFPVAQELTLFYGPLEAVSAAVEVNISSVEILQIAQQINTLMAAGDEGWQVTPGNILPESFDVSGGEINTAQALYAMAMLYASSYAGEPVNSVHLPNTQPVPQTYEILNALSCWDCYDSAWSLKPATIHP